MGMIGRGGGSRSSPISKRKYPTCGTHVRGFSPASEAENGREVHKPSHLGMLKVGPMWAYPAQLDATFAPPVAREYPGEYAQAVLSTVHISIRVALMNIYPYWPFIVTFCDLL